MFGLTKSAISAMPIIKSVADFCEMFRLGNVKLPILTIRHCRNTWMPREYSLNDRIKDNKSSISKY